MNNYKANAVVSKGFNSILCFIISLRYSFTVTDSKGAAISKEVPYWSYCVVMLYLSISLLQFYSI